MGHTNPPAPPAVVALIGGPPLFVAQQFKTVVGFSVVHDRPNPAAAQQGHSMQADVDILVEQATIGKTGPQTVDQADHHIRVLESFAVPAQQLGVNPRPHDVVKVVVDFHHFLHIIHHHWGLFKFGLTDVHSTAIFESDHCTWPGFQVHCWRLQ